jgi:predicted phosphoadenosine phosphosulfate sulfurtransferase
MKVYRDQNVLDAARERVAYAFDHFEKISVSFSGGKDSSVMLHLVMAEAIKRDRTVTVLIIDMEAQYTATIEHIRDMVTHYADHIDLHWVCVPLTLRNAVTNYEPKWTCWDPEKEDIWVRPLPAEASTGERYPWFVPGMEFEEFVPLWSAWQADGATMASFVGIRADESLNRFRTIASSTKEMHDGHRWTTLVDDQVYNVYPIYDWRTQDIWRFHARYPELAHNRVYDLMHQAGVPLSQQRLCQPYGDDQRRGLWLYHILEPATWFKLITRVNGANAGALYVQENGNVMGYHKITKPEGHTWRSFVNLLLLSLPKPTREHYISRFRSFIDGWRGRGYDEIPDEAPKVLEDAHWAPSWRRMAKVLLRNDHWCKGLGLTQPKSDAYGQYLEIKKIRKGVSA